jgi:tagatose-6-phosphate ketose/aldose isomerase
MFMSGDPLAARYDLDLLRELSGDDAAGALLAIGEGGDPGLEGVAWLRVASPAPGAAPAGDAQLMFPYIACAQMYAFFRSLELGRRPDVPNDSGVVNRVVRGVTLHGLG